MILNLRSQKSMLKTNNWCKKEMSITTIRKKLKNHLILWLININPLSNLLKNFETTSKSILKSKNKSKTNWSNKLLKNKRKSLRRGLKNKSTSLRFKKKNWKRPIKLLNKRLKLWIKVLFKSRKKSKLRRKSLKLRLRSKKRTSSKRFIRWKRNSKKVKKLS